MPDIDHLRQLVAFADKGTLSGTARELHMSQPAVSERCNGWRPNLRWIFSIEAITA